MAFCLTKQFTDKFLQALRSGEINPEKMIELTSIQRRDYLANFVGVDNAKEVNALFESKLLLKNQKRGLISWAKKVGGLSKTERKSLEDQIRGLSEALDPKSEIGFLEDLVNKRLRVEITEDEVKTITELTSKMDDEWSKVAKELGTQDPLAIKAKMREIDSDYFTYQQQLHSFMRDQAPRKVYKNAFEKVLGYPTEALQVLRSLVTGPDVSFTFRQGFAMLGTKEWRDSMKNLIAYGKSDVAVDALERRILKSEFYDQISKVEKDLGLTLFAKTIRQREEQFANDVIKKIPVWAQTSRANEAFINELRFKAFERALRTAKEAGENINDKEFLKTLAYVIGANTGRGKLPRSIELASGAMGTAFFSPRWVASRVRLITNALSPKIKGTAKKEAQKALGRSMAFTIGVLGLASAAGLDVEKDPRSSDFGKLKTGNTRIDVTGGVGQLITLVSRLMPYVGGVKSTVTGKVSPLSTGEFGSRTRASVLADFFANKLAPMPKLILEAMEGENFEGTKLTTDWTDWSEVGKKEKEAIFWWLAEGLAVPMMVGSVQDSWKSDYFGNNLKQAITTGTSEFFGFGTSSYGYTPTNKEWVELKNKNPDKYEEKVKQLNLKLEKELDKLEKTQKYKKADQEKKNKLIDEVITEQKNKLVKPKKK